jgi:phosphate transport system substrate-binding protein
VAARRLSAALSKESRFMNLKCMSNQSDRRRRGGAIVLVLVLAVCSVAAAAEDLRIAGTGAALGTAQLLAGEFSRSNRDITITTIANLGSVGSIKAVSQGAIELALASRPLNERESKLGVSQLEYARTPFVFAVSAKSAVRAITRQDLADIYSGKMANWPDGSVIRVVLRPVSDIDTAMVKALGPAIGQAVAAAEKRPGVQYSVTDQDAANDLERIPGAIGPSSLALILSERRALRALQLDGVEPSVANVASKAYPLYKQIFFVTGAQRSAAAERFIAFAQSPAGRKILTENGHWIP